MLKEKKNDRSKTAEIANWHRVTLTVHERQSVLFAKAQHTDASWQHIAGRQQPQEEEEKKKNGKPFTLTEVIKSPFFDRQRCV